MKNRMIDIENIADKNRHEVLAGENAFAAGMEVNECPYRINNPNRTPWMSGWYNARTRMFLKHVFDKHGIDW